MQERFLRSNKIAAHLSAVSRHVPACDHASKHRNALQHSYMRRESDEEEVSGSDAGDDLGADAIEASDDSDVVDVEAPSRKRKAPQTALKVGQCLFWLASA